MNWISSLLKHLSISRSAVVAVFITTGTLYLGPKIIPAHFDTIPIPWSILVQATLLFSGCLVLFWAWNWAAYSVSKICRTVAQIYRSKNLDQNEIDVLFAMGEKPREPLDIGRIDFKKQDFPLSELEFLQILNGLVSKGLASKNRFASNLFSLTERGRKVALNVTRSVKNQTI